MRHIFFIDSIEKLNPTKDSTLMMAHTFKQMGLECLLLFEDDFYLVTDGLPVYKLYTFRCGFKKDSFYLQNFELDANHLIQLHKSDILHMRIDPPYDSRYQRYLWMLDFLKHHGIRVVNDPIGIMNNNEKLACFKNHEMSPLSFVGSSIDGFKKFIKRMIEEKIYAEIIMKPLDLYSGIGVDKFSLYQEDLVDAYQSKILEFGGSIIVQPFLEEVYKGELRTIFYGAQELGTIIKYPVEGSYLSNIAQGATFEKIELPHPLRIACQEMAWDLKESGVELTAFDILGGKLTEVNVTCPGLITEVSEAHGKNLAEIIGKSFL
jgi:glutathione synthase